MHPIRRILTYSSVNALLFPLNLIMAWLLTQAGIHYLLATCAGFGTQLSLGFFLNRRWTFEKSEIKASSGLLKSYVVGVGAFVIVISVTTVGVEFLRLEFIWARLLAATLAGAWDYVMDSWFTFRTHPFR